jgi:hypothetical protein
MVILENDPNYVKNLPRPQKAKIHLTNRVARQDCILTFHGIGHRLRTCETRKTSLSDGDLIPQKDPNIVKKHDPTGMGWVEDVYVSIRKHKRGEKT